MKKLISVIFVSLALAACGGGSSNSGTTATPAAPPSVDVTGTWRGSVTESYFGTSTHTLNAVQTGPNASGTYSSINGTGSVAATVSGNTMSFTISPTGCTGSVNGTGTVSKDSVTGLTSMAITFSGTYVCNGTTIVDSGTGNLVKQ